MTRPCSKLRRQRNAVVTATTCRTSSAWTSMTHLPPTTVRPRSFFSSVFFSVYMVCMMFRLPRSFFSLQCYHLIPYSNIYLLHTFTQALPSFVKMFVYIVILWIFSLLLTNVTSMGCFLQCDFLQMPTSTRTSSPAIQLTATTCSSPSCVR